MDSRIPEAGGLAVIMGIWQENGENKAGPERERERESEREREVIKEAKG